MVPADAESPDLDGETMVDTSASEETTEAEAVGPQGFSSLFSPDEPVIADEVHQVEGTLPATEEAPAAAEESPPPMDEKPAE